MPNSYFQFKKFRIEQKASGMKVTTDACLFGAWCASELRKNPLRRGRLLDIGTGTGLLSLMIAQRNEEMDIKAIELNTEAFHEAASNFKSSPWDNRLTCEHTAFQNFNSDPADFIICNPPFFAGSQQGTDINKNQAIHAISLTASELLENVLPHLKDDGLFFLLYPEKEMKAFIDIAEASDLHVQKLITVRNQEAGPIFRVMASFRKSVNKKTSEELIIRAADQQYTSQFWELLSPYYLEYNAPKYE